ncbi:hypothetical protein HRUBRA_02846 [Pseudohaliea rubra DSM 19751]|uniref:Uncharacterized protein n=1 Tax=Pseudohaliea rubra DSM 19751 TaxID=1265313 RepID=A0A095XSG4_9GAMM|nr:hypothetical protein HRUBRA_02846 [Pseudohaliea rubra DSM 19751]
MTGAHDGGSGRLAGAAKFTCETLPGTDGGLRPFKNQGKIGFFALERGKTLVLQYFVFYISTKSGAGAVNVAVNALRAESGARLGRGH